MSDAEGPLAPNPKVVPMLRRIGEAIRTVFGLVESVDQLKARNEILTANVDELRRELDRQSGQVNVLMAFVRDALDNKMRKEADAAAHAVLVEFESKLRTKARAKKK